QQPERDAGKSAMRQRVAEERHPVAHHQRPHGAADETHHEHGEEGFHVPVERKKGAGRKLEAEPIDPGIDVLNERFHRAPQFREPAAPADASSAGAAGSLKSTRQTPTWFTPRRNRASAPRRANTARRAADPSIPSLLRLDPL